MKSSLQRINLLLSNLKVDKMTSITFYGGVEEIGGNIILLEDRGSSLLVDFGKSFNRYRKFFDELHRPNSFKDYWELGLVPKLNVYREDLIKNNCTERPAALIISHSHLDHCGFLPFLHPDIKIFCSSQTYKGIEAFEKVGKKSFDTEMTSYTEIYDPERKVIFRNMKFPKPTKKNPNRKPIYYRTMLQERIPPEPVERKFEKRMKFSVDGIECELYNVDHSIPDACGCILYTSDTTIAYTGDIRFHGPNAERSFNFIEKVKEERPDVLIVEGTRLHEETTLTEEDVRWQSEEIVKSAKGFVFADFQYRDIYRLNTFKRVAEATGRIMLTSKKHATYWKYFEDYYPHILENVALFHRRAKTRMRGRPPELEHVSDEEIRSHPERYLIHLTYNDFGKLIDFSPFKDAIMISSVSEPYNEEEEIEAQRIDNWLKHFNIRKFHLHSSGHLSGPDFEWMIKEVKPKIILPLHTTQENCIKMKEMFPSQVKCLNLGEKFEMKQGLLKYV
jgi:ribonuclease J